MTALALDGVSVSLAGKTVLADVSLSVEEGGWIGVIGPNGAGKSTLLRAVAGLVRFDGAVTIGGKLLSALDRRELARRIAFVPQAPVTPEDMRVAEYVLLARTPHLGAFGSERDDDVDRAAAALRRLDLAGFAERRLGSLSGGERQRVVLARALAQETDVLLLDEPTSSLDLGYQQQLLDLLDDLRRERRLTVLCAMHDLTLAGGYADSLMLLDGGRTVAWGPTREVLTVEAIGYHYGARVEVVDDPIAGILVVPRRAGTGAGER